MKGMHNKPELFKLVKDERKLYRLMDALTACVRLSARTRTQSRLSIVTPQISGAEYKRRLDWITQWAMSRIRDNHWAVERVVDKCFATLLDFLDSKNTDPGNATMWAAEG